MARTPEYPRLPLRDNATGTSLILITFALLALGVVLVPSALASFRERGEWYQRVDYRHVIYAIIAGAMLLGLWRFNYHRFLSANGTFPWPAAVFLGVALLLGGLVYIPGIGKSVGGYHRWVQFGSSFTFQPSELIKLALLIFLSAFLSKVNVRSIWTFAFSGMMILGCVGLIATQDFGTAAIIGVSAGVTLLLAGVPWYYLASLLVPASGAFYFLVLCDPMRVQRMQTMLDPWGSYQARQALLAILSGGWFGKGLGMGMLKLGYLPEDSTDYVFAILCEEMGLVGGTFLLVLLILWFVQACRASLQSGSKFGQLLAGSLGFVIGLQALLHIAVNLSVAPQKGIGLPFVSAGGTSMIMMAAAVALIVSVTSRRRSPEAEFESVAAASAVA